MNLFCMFFRRAKDLEVSTEMVNKADISDELSRLYDRLLAEHECEPEEPQDNEHPKVMMLLRR